MVARTSSGTQRARRAPMVGMYAPRQTSKSAKQAKAPGGQKDGPAKAKKSKKGGLRYDPLARGDAMAVDSQPQP